MLTIIGEKSDVCKYKWDGLYLILCRSLGRSLWVVKRAVDEIVWKLAFALSLPLMKDKVFHKIHNNCSRQFSYHVNWVAVSIYYLKPK